MEHLLSPRNATYANPKVPLVCGPLVIGRYWDGGDFLTYAARAGHQWRHFNVDDDLGYRYHWLEAQKPSATQQLEAFLQRWLWFGMLEEAFSRDDLYFESDWIETVDGISYASSRTLPAVMTAYELLVSALEPKRKIERCQRMHKCLRRYFSLIWVLRADAGSHDSFNAAIRASLISLYDQLNSAWDKLYDDVSGSLPFTPAMDAFGTFTTQEVDVMKENGWCPGLIHLETKETSSPALRRYLSQLKQYPAADHSRCSEDMCQWEQIRPDYRPRHTSEDCDCPMIGPELDKVEQILNADTYPVLVVTGNDRSSVQVDVLPHDPSRSYVAITHVWAQGMGNPSALKLPACQVLRMQAAVKSIEGRTFVWPVDKPLKEEGPLYLWCDSLLCPTVLQPSNGSTEEEKATFAERDDVKHQTLMKNAALKHMRKVYTDAKYVLLLDQGLEHIDYAVAGAIEAGVRLLTSQWSQRLWTFQEAALPTKLLVSFRDDIVDYRDIALEIRALYKADIVLRPLTFALVNRLLQLRALQYQSSDRPNDLLAFSKTFGRRRYSVESDLPLCAGTLLGLDTGEIATIGDVRQRMAALWRLLAAKHGVPGNLVFLDVPKLNDIPGMRWAPSSFSEQLGRLTDPIPTSLTQAGLNINVPSWKIRRNTLPWAPAGFLLEGLVEGRALFWMHEPLLDQWYKVTIRSRHEEDLNKLWRAWVTSRDTSPYEWRVLFETPITTHSMARGMLYVFDSNRAEPPVLRSIAPLDIRAAVGDELTIQRAAYRNAQALRRSQMYRHYQALYLRGSLFELVLRWRTSIRRFLKLRALYCCLIWLARFYASRVVLELVAQRSRAAWTLDLTNAIESMHGAGVDGEDTFLGSNTVLLFHAQYATIEETLDEQQWCVD